MHVIRPAAPLPPLRLRGWFALLPVALLMAGCASMSESECRRADWYEAGRRDGNAGQPESRLADHRKACEKAGIWPDGERWLTGWRETVRNYCRPTVAWQAGSTNQTYLGACRDINEGEFLRWYQAGQDVYRTRQQRATNQQRIEALEAQLKKADKEDERKLLRERIRDLDTEQARLRRLLDNLERGAPR